MIVRTRGLEPKRIPKSKGGLKPNGELMMSGGRGCKVAQDLPKPVSSNLEEIERSGPQVQSSRTWGAVDPFWRGRFSVSLVFGPRGANFEQTATYYSSGSPARRGLT